MGKHLYLSRGVAAISVMYLTLTASAYYGGGSGSPGDIDGDGWVGVLDLAAFVDCMAGPGAPPDPTPPVTPEECLETFDADLDTDVDWNDYGSFAVSGGHTPIPLKDAFGEELLLTSTAPYSGRQTCGGCHDIDAIANAYHFQQGRTDGDGNIIMQDDFFGDGRFFVRSPGMFGKW